MDSFLQLLFFLHPERFVLGLQASCRSLRVDGIGIAGCEYPSWAYHHLPPFCAPANPRRQDSHHACLSRVVLFIIVFVHIDRLYVEWYFHSSLVDNAGCRVFLQRAWCFPFPCVVPLWRCVDRSEVCFPTKKVQAVISVFTAIYTRCGKLV